ncbi:Protoporphyrinogen oxidase protein [Dioscorea alata]|uniref:Protoporphyrinogen oxidase protein n=1 Tax=Dioscorea alata TaxID=55571 RepID=A0ACB7VHQ7_DIOAL|nr:Protoporphyrinogen oxidase protein [Dioscorea alata]
MSAGSASTVAVVGGGISGAVCASILASRGVSVSLFESGRGAGGRMSQRREITEDGKELFFDHGAPFFSVEHDEVKGLVESWMARGIVAEWNVRFASFDRATAKFVDFEKEGASRRLVGIPGMNSICKALCLEPGVESKFGTTVGKMVWLPNRSIWSLTGLDGQDLGYFNGLVASDKNVASPRFKEVTGRPPPLDVTSSLEGGMLLKDIPVCSCFAAMLAFQEPLSSVPVKGFSFKNSQVLSWAFCDTSKPGRSCVPDNVECWVLHSTHEYAARIISMMGLQKPSNDILAKVAEELFQEFQTVGPYIPRPLFMRAHRWGSAFPMTFIGGEEKCLWDKSKRLAICGDFCVSPNVEGAILSGLCAASKMIEIQSNL